MTLSDLAPGDEGAVRALIVDGLTERWGVYDASRNPDLDHLLETYRDAVFLVGRVDGAIVACGALLGEGDSTGRIIRMSVARTHRRTGLGGAVLNALIERARALGYTRIVLETTASWRSAIAFYESHGFEFVAERDGDCHFAMNLAT